mmetsp:Transcript_42687/g.132238  ORF Transcript_42687/g.132238 Transcript_42687/m.132238 type:complete len:202 (+) Transcript_42687:400-1005(+)
MSSRTSGSACGAASRPPAPRATRGLACSSGTCRLPCASGRPCACRRSGAPWRASAAPTRRRCWRSRGSRTLRCRRSSTRSWCVAGSRWSWPCSVTPSSPTLRARPSTCTSSRRWRPCSAPSETGSASPTSTRRTRRMAGATTPASWTPPARCSLVRSRGTAAGARSPARRTAWACAGRSSGWSCRVSRSWATARVTTRTAR